MAIRFSCARRGHSIEVDDHLAGRTGHCTHCGHTMVVPDADPTEAVSQPAGDHGLHLHPLVSARTPAEDHDPRLAQAPDVTVRPLTLISVAGITTAEALNSQPGGSIR